MSLLQSTPSLLGFGHHRNTHTQTAARPRSSGQKQPQLPQKPLQPSGSLSSLIDFVRNPTQTMGEAVENWYEGTTKEERDNRQVVEDRKQLLYAKMRMATSYADWEAAAKELDDVEGNNVWKAVFDSPDYDARLVEARLKQLDSARISCDIERMLFLIRTSLTRDLGDMGNLRMYKHTHIGTKDLVERYINSALETLDALLKVSAKAKCDGLESKYILEQVLSSRQAFGRSALLLSGGATFGMNHIGVLRALWEARLLPRIISGASAGSIVGAVYCTRIDEEIPHLMETFCDGDLAVFDEEGNEDSLVRKAVRFLKHGALFDINHLTRVMRELLGDLTFQEAYNRTRKILNICVSSASLYELPRLLNYVTAPNVLIWSAVAASCSVPFVYTPASILAKDPKTGEAVPWNPSPQRWIDGSVDNDIPMTRLAEMFNVNHFIVSQVNPHVVPFVMKEENSIAQEALQASSSFKSGHTWFENLSQLAKGEALYRMHTLVDLGVFPTLLTKTVSVLSQKYSGDITIFPEISYADFPRMLSNPTPEFMHHAMLSGQRATWPKLSIIKNHCAIELALDDAVQKLRARVVFSPDEVEQRMGAPQLEKRVSDSHNAARHRTRRRRLSRGSMDTTISAPATAKPNSSAPTVHGHERPRSSREPRSGRVTPAAHRHKKSLSINTIIAPPRTSPRLPSSADTIAPPLQPTTSHQHPSLQQPLAPTSRALYDVTSSGADETSNLSQSSSSTSLSTTASPPSDQEGETTKWARSLFGTSSSQPNTPKEFSRLALTPRTSSKRTTTTPTKPAAFPVPKSRFSSKSQKATPPPRSTATSPESRYKRIFHHNRSQGDSGAESSSKTGSNKPRPNPPSSSAKATPVPPSATAKTALSQSAKTPPTSATKTPNTNSSSSSSTTPSSTRATSKAPKRNWGMEIDIPKSAKGLVGKGKKKSLGGAVGGGGDGVS